MWLDVKREAHIGGLVQDRCNSIAIAPVLLQSCI